MQEREGVTDISKNNQKEFVELLNSYTDEETGQYPAEWKKWEVGENGYPILVDEE